ncbi:glycosyltransferase family 4 protein [Micromonospora sp. DR5-3]|uniref:glycosyltransferase family 4 protein n=1 Tax=unclassified Micromonospora TaxID=2617518 RepID=UPI0011D36161|nr:MULTISPECIES: glycosyltransferase family 4 protein [unclassified Micromonospora]MCW3815015.1 glycosyltransferase family 4 protein [Micromonospora sp. DR5-3]TYC25333.1 glycosyltransferase family 4 protein [Micromonospora sp. MP36]
MEAGSTPRPTRGRVVMLVDNGVQGDSRVQKTARSAAEAGWDVVLLGILSNGAQENWSIGDARVRLIRVPRSLGQHPSQFHRSLRRPLAYPPGRHGGYRIQRMKAWQAAIEERRVALAVARRTGSASLTQRLGGLLAPPASLAARALGRWAKFRGGELHRLRLRQQDPDNLITRTSIRFWQTLLGPRSWRRLDRGLWDYELAFGPVIDQLAPDIIHANDFRMIGVGARAARRARARGLGTKLVWDAHEFVGGVLGRADNPRWLPAQVAHVEEYIGAADAVITVSATLAELLQRTHRLPVRPDVVLNAPPRPVTGVPDDGGTDVRDACGIDAATPLLVYCGGVNPSRGVELMIDALPQLEKLHVALVTLHPTASNAASEALRARAVELGVADRVHLLPYVPHWRVPAFLASADAGVIPIHHKPNHELALITKFLEYSHARLPIVVSDVRTMADTVRETGQGEVFRAEDVADYLRAVRAVLADPARYRAAYDRPGLLDGWTWEAQAEVLEGVYRRLRPDLAPPAAAPTGAAVAAG